jgi:hypothetical protein
VPTAIVEGIDPDEIAHRYVSGVLAVLRVKPTGSVVMTYAAGHSIIIGHLQHSARG